MAEQRHNIFVFLFIIICCKLANAINENNMPYVAYVTNDPACDPLVAALNDTSRPFCELADAADVLTTNQTDYLLPTFIYFINYNANDNNFILNRPSIFVGNRSLLTIDCIGSCALRCVNNTFPAMEFNSLAHPVELNHFELNECAIGLSITWYNDTYNHGLRFAMNELSFSRISQTAIISLIDVSNAAAFASDTAIVMTNCRVENNVPNYDPYNYPLTQLTAQSVAITNCSFNNCYSAVRAALWIYGINGTANSRQNFTIIGSTFSNNFGKANTSSGGVYLELTSQLMGTMYLADNIFTNNTGGDGGGLYIDNQSELNITISNCKFVRNFAVFEGAGLYILSTFAGANGVRLKIENSLFYENSAIGDGGAILLDDFSRMMLVPSILSTIIRQNRANGDGAGLLARGPAGLLVDNCLITDNKGLSAVYFSFVQGEIANSEISYNSISAAAVYHVSNSDQQLKLTNTSINFNSATALLVPIIVGKRDSRGSLLTPAILQHCYIWGNAGFALSSQGQPTSTVYAIDANQQNSIYQNAWAVPGGIDTECLYGGAIGINNQDGCTACSSYSRDICGVCNGNSACLLAGCQLPYASSCTIPMLADAGSSIAVEFSGINPVLYSSDQQTELVTLKFEQLIDIASSGKQTAYSLSQIQFLPSAVYNLVGAQQSIDFTGVLPNGAKVALQQTLVSGASQIVNYADTVFTINNSTLKVSLLILNWPTNNTVRLDLRAVYKSTIKSFESATRESIIEETTIRSRYTTTTVSLANVAVSSNANANSQITVPVKNIAKKLIDDSTTLQFLVDFNGPIGSSLLYDPDIGAVISPDAGGNSNNDDSTADLILVKVLVPVLVGTCLLCVCLIIIVAIIVTLIAKLRANRMEVDYDGGVEI